MSFLEEISKEISANLYNDYDDNWDYSRFGSNNLKKRGRLTEKIRYILNKRGYYHMTEIQTWIVNSFQIGKFEYLFNHLEFGDDKRLLLKVLAYRILGYKKVKLPLNSPEHWDRLKGLDVLVDKSDFINPGFMHLSLYKLNLERINYPIQFYFTTEGILTDFIIKQYEYNHKGKIIKAEKGDIVIDGGGCWGDTALYFANEVGSRGRVFSFEFIPRNIEIFERNVLLNQLLAENIELIKHPLWKDSSTKLYFKDNGPGSVVSDEPSDDLQGTCYTLSIDELVKMKDLQRVDFIKMDIEGAETNALKGAHETIRKFKPKLAIALYHSADDFESIPSLVREMDSGYKFYFSHCSIHAEESMLFAEIR